MRLLFLAPLLALAGCVSAPVAELPPAVAQFKQAFTAHARADRHSGNCTFKILEKADGEEAYAVLVQCDDYPYRCVFGVAEGEEPAALVCEPVDAKPSKLERVRLTDGAGVV